MSDIKPQHFLWQLDESGVALVTLNRPEKYNTLRFELIEELLEPARQDVAQAAEPGSRGWNAAMSGILGPIYSDEHRI